MPRWTFEPGHTAAAFRARHMMVTWVRGTFPDVHGSIEFDPADLTRSSVEVTIDAAGLLTGEVEHDTHLRAEDFLHVEKFRHITFRGSEIDVIGDHDFAVRGDLTLRGVTRPTTLEVEYLGQWLTPWWEEEDDGWVDKGPKQRAGFTATTVINRHDFGVSWNDQLDRGGMVVGEQIHITLDAEAILDGDEA